MHTFDSTRSLDGIPQLSIAQTATELEGEVLLLDVRTDAEFAAGHAPDARHIELAELPTRIDELDPATPIVLICLMGGRSQAAATLLSSHGFTVANVIGGMAVWEDEGHPVVNGDGAPGIVV